MTPTETLKSELTELWKEALKLPDNLKEVGIRPFVYCKNKPVPDTKKKLLIVGINPSFRKNEPANESYDYFDFQEIIEGKERDAYFHKIHETIPEDKRFSQLYSDLFYLRQTEQVGLKDFMENPVGLAFLVEQLKITQNYIEALKPDLIVIFNKGSWKYWGLEAKRESNIWMGYQFEKDENLNLHRIKGLHGSTQRINRSLSATKLLGTPVYFSKYLKYLSQAERARIAKELGEIMTSIDSDQTIDS